MAMLNNQMVEDMLGNLSKNKRLISLKAKYLHKFLCRFMNIIERNSPNADVEW